MAAECENRVGKGTVTWQCNVGLPPNHPGPCAAPEVPRTMRERKAWEDARKRPAVTDANGPVEALHVSEERAPHPDDQAMRPQSLRDFSRDAGLPDPAESITFAANVEGRDGERREVKVGPYTIPVVVDHSLPDDTLQIRGEGGNMGPISVPYSADAPPVAIEDNTIKVTLPGSHSEAPDTPGPTKQRPGDQALPTVNDEDSAQDRAIGLIEHAKAVGIKRYGTVLQPWNGRDALQDALEEARDHFLYMTQIVMAREATHQRLLDVVTSVIERMIGDYLAAETTEVLTREIVGAILRQTALAPVNRETEVQVMTNAIAWALWAPDDPEATQAEMDEGEIEAARRAAQRAWDHLHSYRNEVGTGE